MENGNLAHVAAPANAAGAKGHASSQDTKPFVRFAGVQKNYGVLKVVKDLDLDIQRGEFLTLLGPSGSGKTTTLMMLAGFEHASEGEILIDDKPVTQLPPHKRGIGVVFQSYALFPHMTVAQNLAFPLEVRGIEKAEIASRVRRALEMVELPSIEDRRPMQLSGGQQQRIALARALIFEPPMVLMDEPLGALDKHLREQMQYEIKELHRKIGITMVYVTHDQTEALTMSDRIAVFNHGRIQQLSDPFTLYARPSNAFVAGFIGENNALPGTLQSKGPDGICTVELRGGELVTGTTGDDAAIGEKVLIFIRPEFVDIGGQQQSLRGTVTDSVFHGDHVRFLVSAGGIKGFVLKAPQRSSSFRAGDEIALSWNPADARVFKRNVRD